MRVSLFSLFVLLLASTVFSAASEDKTVEIFPDPALFPLPAGYRPNVDFWIRVYGEWEEDDMVIHDAENMNIIFDVIDIPDENNLLRAAASASLKKRMDEIKRILIELHKNPGAFDRSDEHKKIFDLYKNIHDSQKFRKASENLRMQLGIKERFQTGLELMTQYVDQIKRIMRQEGIPEEIAYLPLVESSFVNHALSKTKAAGIWQFMPGTARIYMKVNRDVDERLDPFIASRSAARYLRRSYQMFGSWPLALTSYNHGQAGIMNAINTVGTRDFYSIYSKYTGKYYGFASRNFYAEFLAAYNVMKNAEKYFGDVDYKKALVHDSVTLSKPLSMAPLLKTSNLSREEIRAYNPALQSSVIFGKRNIPAGYELRLPPGKVGDLTTFIARVRASAPEPRVLAAKPTTTATKTPKVASAEGTRSRKTHVVRKGDTLFSISRRYSTTVELLRRWNRLTHNRIFPGQRLSIYP